MCQPVFFRSGGFKASLKRRDADGSVKTDAEERDDTEHYQYQGGDAQFEKNVFRVRFIFLPVSRGCTRL